MSIEELFPAKDCEYQVIKTVDDPVNAVAQKYISEFFAVNDANRIVWIYYMRNVLGIFDCVNERCIQKNDCLPEIKSDQVYIQLCSRKVQGIGIIRTEKGTEIGMYDFCKDVMNVDL